MSELRLDNIYYAETPEGVDLNSHIAGIVPRVLAYMIDISIRIVALIVLSFFTALLGKGGVGLFLLVSFVLEWFYPVIFEVYFQGQTPGKKAMNLRVVNEDLTPIGWGGSIIRNLLRAADFFPSFFAIGLASMMCTKRFQRLGDLAASSLVIYHQLTPASSGKIEGQSRQPPFPLLMNEQIALMNYAERGKSLSQERKQELADIVADEFHYDRGRSARNFHEIGLWLLGGGSK